MEYITSERIKREKKGTNLSLRKTKFRNSNENLKGNYTSMFREKDNIINNTLQTPLAMNSNKKKDNYFTSKQVRYSIFLVISK